METKTYKVIPRMPIRGIKDKTIYEESELELNELELLKVLLMGHQVFDGEEQVKLTDIVPEVDPQAIPSGTLIDDPTHKDAKFVASSECKVFGSPREYTAPIIEAEKKEDTGDTESGSTTEEPVTPPAVEDDPHDQHAPSALSDSTDVDYGY